MKRECLPRKLVLVLALLALMGGTLSCKQEEAGPRAWIDFPQEGASVPVGGSVVIMSHAYAREGVAEVILSVNGEPYRRDGPPQPGASFLEVSQEWRPEEEGVYALQVTTYDTTGAASNPDTVSVTVAGTAVQVPITPTHTPTPPSPPTFTPTPTWTPVTGGVITPTFVPTPTLTPAPAFTPTPTATPTSQPRPLGNIRLWADDESIQAGNCTRVFWNVYDVRAYWVNGQAGVGGDGSFRTCPCQDETHRLRVVQRDGTEQNLSLTIKVSGQCGASGPPPDTEADIRFWADSKNLEAESCTRVHWHVSNVRAYWVNGQAGVRDDGSFETCPCQEETHTLRVQLRDGTEQNLTLTIQVSGQCEG